MTSIYTSYDEEKITESLAPLREYFDKYIFVMYFNGELDEETEDYYLDILTQRGAHEDGIIISYNGDKGTAKIHIGSLTGIEIDNLQNICESFAPAESAQDYSGFASGIEALAQELAPKSTVNYALILGGAVLAAAIIATVIVKRKKA